MDTQREAFHGFLAWAGEQGYDTAHAYDTERSRWVALNPMTADLLLAWTASRKVALEEAANSCAGLLDEKEEARAQRAANEAAGTASELDRLKHWATVSTYNAGIRRCIATIRNLAGAAGAGQRE